MNLDARPPSAAWMHRPFLGCLRRVRGRLLHGSALSSAGILSLLLAVLTLGALSAAQAQNERHGIRVHYTSLAPAGGLEGRAFLPVSGQGVSQRPSLEPACQSQPLLTIQAALHRGPLRALQLHIASRQLGRAPLSESGCARVAIEASLEDGSVLKGGQGYIELTSLPSPADPTFRGAFAQTTSLRGVPVTIEGKFVVPAAKPSLTP